MTNFTTMPYMEKLIGITIGVVLTIFVTGCGVAEDEVNPNLELPFEQKTVELEYNLISNQGGHYYEARLLLYDTANVTLTEDASYLSPVVTGKLDKGHPTSDPKKIVIPLPDFPKEGVYYRWIVIKQGPRLDNLRNKCGGGGKTDIINFLTTSGEVGKQKIRIKGGYCSFD
jgi:hypothetical protein